MKAVNFAIVRNGAFGSQKEFFDDDSRFDGSVLPFPEEIVVVCCQPALKLLFDFSLVAFLFVEDELRPPTAVGGFDHKRSGEIVPWDVVG